MILRLARVGWGVSLGRLARPYLPAATSGQTSKVFPRSLNRFSLSLSLVAFDATPPPSFYRPLPALNVALTACNCARSRRWHPEHHRAGCPRSYGRRRSRCLHRKVHWGLGYPGRGPLPGRGPVPRL